MDGARRRDANPAAAASVRRAQSDPEHYPFIDALRGCAVLAVIAVHVGGRSSPPGWLGRISADGNYGVQLFFVLSAFTLLSSMHARRGRDRRPTAAFFVRRLFRIAPLFWLAAAFYTGLNGLGATPKNPAVGTPQILATLAFLHGWHPTSINSVVPGGWSIAVEMNFYLLLPLCFLWIDSLERALVSFLILAPLSCAGSVLARRWLTGADPAQAVSIGLFTYYWFPRQAPVFLLGFILFFLIQRARAARAARDGREATANAGSGGAKFAGRSLLALASLGLVALSLLADRIPVAYLVFSAAWTAFALGLSRYPTKAIVNPLLRYCGKVSYSAYLTHFFVLDRLSGPLMRGLDGLGLAAHSPLRFAGLYLAAVAGTLLLSTVTYHLIESPGQQLGRYLIGRLDAGPAPALQAG